MRMAAHARPRAATHPAKAHVDRERHELLRHVDQALTGPIMFLSIVWLAVVIGVLFNPHDPTLIRAMWALWAVFVLQFLAEFVIAPVKLDYLRQHWITAVSLLMPAFGVLRVLPILQMVFTAQSGGYFVLLQLLTSTNRGFRAMGRLIHGRGLGYVAGLSVVVIFGGAGGMLFFESPQAVRAVGASGGLTSFGDALWYSAMQITTVGSAYGPVTAQGRILSFLITVFGVSVAGYVTASVATYLVGKDRKEDDEKKEARS